MKNKKETVAKKIVKKAKKEAPVVEKKEKKVKDLTVSKEAVEKQKKKVVEEVSADKKEEKRKQWLLGDPLEVKKLIGTLQHEAMLVKISMKAWKGTATDKEIASELAGQMKGMAEGFSVSLRYLPPKIRQELTRRLATMREYVMTNTLPWTDGYRLLASHLYAPLKQAVENSRIQAKDYVDQMTSPAMYPVIIDYAKQTLGKAWNDERVPSPQDIRDAFEVKFEPGPEISIPTKLNGVESKDMAEIQREVTDKFARKYSMGVVEILEGIKETMEMLVEDLEGSQDKTKYKILLDMFDRRVTNIARMDIFKSKKIEIMMDTLLEEIIEPLRAQYKDLKKDGGKRKALLEKGKKVLKEKMYDIGV